MKTNLLDDVAIDRSIQQPGLECDRALRLTGQVSVQLKVGCEKQRRDYIVGSHL